MLAAIKSAVEAAKAIAEVTAKLDRDRSVILEVQNHTSRPLRIANHFHAGGGFAEPPNQEIPPETADIFGSQDRGLFTGTEGGVDYDSSLGFRLHVRWNNPFIGSNEVRSWVSGETARAFTATGLVGSGNVNAHQKYEVHQDVDTRFVRSPDYMWRRLEGFAVSPETTPEQRRAIGLPLVPLHSWYDPDRGDNWTTSDPAYTTPVMERLSPNYRHSRFHGWIVSPSVGDHPSGTLPLHSWWSPGFRDNFCSTNPVLTNPLRMRIDPDYAAYRMEGYLFSPDQPAPEGTVPLHQWQSRSRNDQFMTGHERWIP